jgi:Fur family zinc uptake transcriptional regulator
MSAFSDHDHHACTAGGLAAAEAIVHAAGLRLTPVRRRTLEILLEAHHALGAYEVLARLAEDGYGDKPPVAYRALDFLVEHGLAHKVRRLNAFTACVHPGEAHNPVFLICEGCKAVAELPSDPVHAALSGLAADQQFSLRRMTVEALGLCPNCDA